MHYLTSFIPKKKLKFDMLNKVFIIQLISGGLPNSCFQPLFYTCSSLQSVACPFLIGVRIKTMKIGVWPRTQAVSTNQRMKEGDDIW